MTATAPPPTRQLRRARVAVATRFALNAVFYANLVPRLPELRDELGLSNAALGTALAAAPLGALVMGPAAAVLIARLGSGPVASLGLTGLGVGVAIAASAPNWAVLAEAIQTILRRENYPDPYNALKQLTRTGEAISAATLATFVEGLGVPEGVKAELRQLLERAETLEASLDGVLSPARDALGAGAWVSSAARPFEEGLEEARRDLVRGAQATTAALRAELAAVLDAALQDPGRQAELLDAVIAPLAEAEADARAAEARKAAATRVQFFTMANMR